MSRNLKQKFEEKTNNKFNKTKINFKEFNLNLQKNKAICFDFDGVIHKYSKGWFDGSIYDEYNPNVIDLIILLQKISIPVFICSTREPKQIKEWFDKKIINFKTEIISDDTKFWNDLETVGITNKKLPAQVYIDDRAYKYNNQTPKEFLLDFSIKGGNNEKIKR